MGFASIFRSRGKSSYSESVNSPLAPKSLPTLPAAAIVKKLFGRLFGCGGSLFDGSVVKGSSFLCGSFAGNGVYGGDKASIEGVEMGAIEMSLPATSVLTSYDEKFGLLDMPFLFKSEKAIFDSLDGEIGALYDKILDGYGFHNLGYNYNGPRCISNNTRPINEPADLKGLKIRVMESPVFIDMFNALGANPTPMSFGEIFTGLQQGTVTGQENAPSLVFASRFYEVQKFYSITNHTFSIMPILMNKEFFEGLPAELQAILQKGADEWLIKYQRELEASETADYIKRLEEKGMTVNFITPENHAKFVEAVKPVYDKNLPKIGQDLFDIVAKYNK